MEPSIDDRDPTFPCVSVAGSTRATRADDARLTVVTGRWDAGPQLAAFLEELCAASVDVVRLRRRPSDTEGLAPAVAIAREVCDRHGALLLVDDDLELTVEGGADGIHLARQVVDVAAVRARLGPDLLISRSIRSAGDLAESADEDVDHVSIPVRPTSAGSRDRLHLVRIAASRSPHPWSAAGGIGPSTIASVLAAGARRVVVGAALTRAPDPTIVAWQLRRALGRVH